MHRAVWLHVGFFFFFVIVLFFYFQRQSRGSNEAAASSVCSLSEFSWLALCEPEWVHVEMAE